MSKLSKPIALFSFFLIGLSLSIEALLLPTADQWNLSSHILLGQKNLTQLTIHPGYGVTDTLMIVGNAQITASQSPSLNIQEVQGGIGTVFHWNIAPEWAGSIRYIFSLGKIRFQENVPSYQESLFLQHAIGLRLQFQWTPDFILWGEQPFVYKTIEKIPAWNTETLLGTRFLTEKKVTVGLFTTLSLRYHGIFLQLN